MGRGRLDRSKLHLIHPMNYKEESITIKVGIKKVEISIWETLSFLFFILHQFNTSIAFPHGGNWHVNLVPYLSLESDSGHPPLKASLCLLCPQWINVFHCWHAPVNIIYSAPIKHTRMKDQGIKQRGLMAEATKKWHVFTETSGRQGSLVKVQCDGTEG